MNAATDPLEIAGVTRYTSESPRPHVAIFGSVHGNEPCGLRAIERLQAELSGGVLQLRAGTLYLVHGNPLATEQHERHTRGGVDLNRLFDYRFETDVPAAHWSYEHRRAHELKPLLETMDALLDLHSTTAPAPAFALASPLPASAAFADALGLAYVTQGWDGPGLLGDRVVMAPVTRRGMPAVSVECGQHDDPGSIAVAYACLRRSLDYLGLVGLSSAAEGGNASATWSAPDPSAFQVRLMLRAAVKRPSLGFKFARPLVSMQQMAAGEPIGSDEAIALSAARDCYVIMPNDTVAVGDDMLYIAQLAGEDRS